MSSKLLTFICYGGSAIFGKGLSLLALPLLAHHVSPAELAKLDMMASIVEPLGILALFALGETMFRFSGSSDGERKQLIDELLGIALVGFVLLTVITQALVAPWIGALPNTPGDLAIRAVLFTSCMGVFIELPLAYLRLSDRPLQFLFFVAGRSIGQLAIVVGAIILGAGVDGILISNAVLDILVVLLLTSTLPKGLNPRLRLAAMGRFLSYGLPLVLGSFSMYGLGSFDRWFLASTVDPQTIAIYAIAAKFSLGLSLLLMPFSLWWYPRRYRVLRENNGLVLTASYWSIGIIALGTASVVAAAFSVAVIQITLPPLYRDAISLLPLLILISLLQECASLSNGISYARATSWHVLKINLLAAAMAVVLYAVLIPHHGIYGAIIATLAAQGFRLCAFLAARHEGRRLPVPLAQGSAFLAGCCVMIFQLCQPGRGDPSMMLVGLVLAIATAGMLGRISLRLQRAAATP